MKTLRLFEKTWRDFLSRYPRLTSAANDLDDIAVANALGGEAVFNVQQGDRLFVPYGRYQHPRGLQIFDRESAETMSRVFNSIGAKIGRFLTGAGAPVYAGHPDVPGRADSNPAAPALGWIEGITAENDGASFAVKWNEDGEKAVSNAHFRFYSAHWNCRPVKGGIQPVQLLSIGLTNNPRIPVPAIANDQTTTEMKLTETLRKLLGIAAENDAPTEAQIEEAAAAVEARIAALAATCNDAQAAHTSALAERDGMKVLLDATTAKVAEAAATATAAANDLSAANVERAALEEKLAAANDLAALEGFTTAARITAAEREPLRAELIALANDALETRLSAIAKAAPKLNTRPLADVGGARKVFAAANDEAARSAQRREAIDAELAAIANDRTFAGLSESDRYSKAFNRAQKKNPDIFPTKATTAKA